MASRAFASPSWTYSTAWASSGCTGYMLDGQRIDLLPMGADEVTRCEPIYESMAGWSGTTYGAQTWDELPPEARAYLHRIEEICEVSIDVVSTGP